MNRLALLGSLVLALALVAVPTAATETALQPVTVACSVDSPFTLATDPDTLTQLTLALAAMTDPACAITKTDPTPAPDPTYAVGGGTALVLPNNERFSFSAHQNTPDPPSGYAHVTDSSSGFEVQGHVTCLIVLGNLAVIGFKIEKGNTPSTFQGARFSVQDNGPPGSVPPDQASPVGITASPPQNCNGFPVADRPVIQGNIVVK